MWRDVTHPSNVSGGVRRVDGRGLRGNDEGLGVALVGGAREVPLGAHTSAGGRGNVVVLPENLRVRRELGGGGDDLLGGDRGGSLLPGAIDEVDRGVEEWGGVEARAIDELGDGTDVRPGGGGRGAGVVLHTGSQSN